MGYLKKMVTRKDKNVKISNKFWKLTFTGKYENEASLSNSTVMQVELYEIKKDQKYLVSFNRSSGSVISFWQHYKDLYKLFVGKGKKKEEEEEKKGKTSQDKKRKKREDDETSKLEPENNIKRAKTDTEQTLAKKPSKAPSKGTINLSKKSSVKVLEKSLSKKQSSIPKKLSAREKVTIPNKRTK